MSGARVSSGADSQQDVGTPLEFIDAVERRFGRIRYDLAAHAGNHKHAIYIAPKMLEVVWDPKLTPLGIFVRQMMRAGAHMDELTIAVNRVLESGRRGTVSVPNHDPNPIALDSFAQDWAALGQRFAEPDGRPGLGWLNCEFADIAPWASKCRTEMARGANALLLTPLTCAGWYRLHIAGRADVIELAERITFLGSTSPYAKDLMLSWFHPRATGARAVWSWKTNTMLQQWVPIGPPGWADPIMMVQRKDGEHGGGRSARGSAATDDPDTTTQERKVLAHPERQRQASTSPFVQDGRVPRGSDT